MKAFAFAWMLAIGGAFAPAVNAANYDYNFTAVYDPINEVSTETGYNLANVKIEGDGDKYDFSIQRNAAGLNDAGYSHYRIVGFAFRADGGVGSGATISGQPDNWVMKGKDLPIVGVDFDYSVLSSRGGSPTSHLEFTVSGLKDNVFDDNNYPVFGLILKSISKRSSGVVFSGLHVTPVPLPAAFWLFGSALLGFAGFRKVQRRKGGVAAIA